MLIIFWMNSRQQHPLWWWIVWLGGFLFILAVVIALSDKGEARTLAWICIGISTLFDGISLLVMALKIKNSSSAQIELISQSAENEIWQWDVIITETVISNDPNSQS